MITDWNWKLYLFINCSRRALAGKTAQYFIFAFYLVLHMIAKTAVNVDLAQHKHIMIYNKQFNSVILSFIDVFNNK